MPVLLPIKPKFVAKIFSNEKQYEFKKVIFKNKQVKDVVIYTSSPVSKVVGEFTIDKIIENTTDKVWA